MTKLLIGIALAFLLASCGRISIHSDENLQGSETGVKFFTPKPFILVSRTGAKDNPVKVEIVYLPDLANPLYARANPGFGSADLDLSFEDGILTTLGQETDPQIDDLITSVAGIPQLLAQAEKTAAEAAAQSVVAQASKEEIETAGRAVASVADEFDRFLSLPTTPDVTIGDQRTSLQRISAALRTQSQSLLSPGAEARLEDTIKALEGSSKQLAAVVPTAGQEGTPPGMQFWGMVAASKATISNAIKVIKPAPKPTPAPAPPPTLTLYEIISTPNGTQLREVKFN